MGVARPDLRVGRLGTARSLPARAGSDVLLLGAIVLLAAVVRFATLGAKSFWVDEGSTIVVLHGSLGHVLHAVSAHEDTPPLYYILAWAWSRAFGLGEVGVRSLSALLGVLTVPVVYAATARLISRRAALTAAALTSVSPLLVWYSQEARSYALLLLLGAVSFLFFVRAVEGAGTGALVAWAVVSVLMLYTHYFALPLVAAEGMWLLWRPPTRRRAAVALVAVASCAIPLLPTFLAHANHGRWVTRIPFADRLLGIPGAFLVGFEAPYLPLFAVVAAGLAAVGLTVLILWGTEAERRGARIAASVGAGVVLAALITPLLGHDLLLSRYVLLALVPVIVTVAAGLGARHAGRLGQWVTAALCAVSLVILVQTAWTPKYGNQDWRAVARALRAPSGERAIVIYPRPGNGNAANVLSVYLGSTTRRLQDAGTVRAGEVDVVSMAHRNGWQVNPPRPRYPPDSPRLTRAGFRLVSRVRHGSFALARYRAVSPRAVGPPTLAPNRRFAGSRAVVLSAG